MDKFTVKIIAAIENPQQVIWLAMHQDYSENFVADHLDNIPTESKCGELVIKHLLSGNKGHFGPIEHPQIVVNVGYFPHSLMQQIRTHRLASFDCQSFRYTGQRIIDVVNDSRNLEEVFYLRPVGDYIDRQGKKYHYSELQRNKDLNWCYEACFKYTQMIADGMSEEHARSILPFDVRQHFVMSCNMRSLMHILDLRWKKDAQLESQIFSEKLFECFQSWSPEIANWYQDNRAHKARLSP